LRDWHEKYEKIRLDDRWRALAGVCLGESARQVRTAIEKLKITFRVVQDNDFVIWKRNGIWAWPTIVVTDTKGVIRYSHIGEGAYEKTGSMIEQLLQEK
jgi:hypothetical protein